MKATLILLGAMLAASPAAAAGAACPPEHKPVCALGADGARATLDNACMAQAQGAKVLHEDECTAPGKEPMMCNMLYQPVCATDPATKAEKTYPNLCHAEVANAVVLHENACTGNTGGG